MTKATVHKNALELFIMHPLLEKYFVKLEKDKADLLNILLAADDAKLNNSPSKEKWSPAQIIYHLVQSEQVSFRYIEKRIKHADKVKTAGIKSSLYSFLVVKGLRLPLKFKAPPLVAEVPASMPLGSLEQQWNEVRIKMKLVLESATDAHLTKAFYIHPVAGPMNLLNTLRFMQEHLYRHKRQILKLLKAQHAGLAAKKS